jgi:hypothetical protein
MDFEKLVSPITNYLTYSIGFWTGDGDSLSNYSKLEFVEPNALLLCLVGVGLMLVLRYNSMGSIPSDNDPLVGQDPNADTNSVFFFLATSLATPLLLEASFWIVGTRADHDFPVAATFNASFLSFALIAPISGVQTRMNFINSQMVKVGGRVAKLSMFLNLTVALGSLILSALVFDIYRTVLNVPWSILWLPIALAILLVSILAVIAGVFLLHWNQYVEKISKHNDE